MVIILSEWICNLISILCHICPIVARECGVLFYIQQQTELPYVIYSLLPKILISLMNICLSLKEFILSFHIIEFQNQTEGMITMLYCTEDSCTGTVLYCIIILGFIYCTVQYFTVQYSATLQKL